MDYGLRKPLWKTIIDEGAFLSLIHGKMVKVVVDHTAIIQLRWQGKKMLKRRLSIPVLSRYEDVGDPNDRQLTIGSRNWIGSVLDFRVRHHGLQAKVQMLKRVDHKAGLWAKIVTGYFGDRPAISCLVLSRR